MLSPQGGAINCHCRPLWPTNQSDVIAASDATTRTPIILSLKQLTLNISRLNFS